MVHKTATVLTRCIAMAILCSRWWCDRGSPVLKEGQGLLPKCSGCVNCHQDKKMARLQIGILHLLPGLQRHQPHLWPASRGMGWRCWGMWHPKQWLDHTSRVLLLNHLVSSHRIDKYQMVPDGQGLQLWPVIAGSARWLLCDRDDLQQFSRPRHPSWAQGRRLGEHVARHLIPWW